MRILYIDIDSQRPDHLGCYGYHRKTSPNLDRLASEGVRFTNFYATDTPCLPSRTAFFTGRFGVNSGVVNHGGTYADLRLEGPERGFSSTSTGWALAEQLRRSGYHTASITPFPHRHSAYQIWEGFHETHDTGKNGQEIACETYPFVEEWLDRRGAQDRWFLHVNFWDPHTPYRTPLAYGDPFKDDPPPSWMTQDKIDRMRKSYGPHDAVTPHPDILVNPKHWLRGPKTIANLDDYKAWIDGYDTAVHYTDWYLGQLFQKLKDLGVYAETAIIISADHGENQGELEVWGDHQTADEITHKVPLIIKWPKVTDDKAGQSFSGLHYNLDLSATITDLAGGKCPKQWDGQSFARTLLRGEDCGREELILSHCAWSVQRSVRWDDYLLIRTYHTGYKNFPSLMLFNVKEDPREERNLVEARPELVAEGLRRMDAWVAAQHAKTGQPDVLYQVLAEGGPFHARAGSKPTAEMLAILRETGRAHHADWLELHAGAPTDLA